MNIPLILHSEGSYGLVKNSIEKFIKNREFGEKLYIYDSNTPKILNLCNDYLTNGEKIICTSDFSEVKSEFCCLIDKNFDYSIDVSKIFNGKERIDEEKRFIFAKTASVPFENNYLNTIKHYENSENTQYVRRREYDKSFRRKILCNRGTVRLFICDNKPKSIASMVKRALKQADSGKYSLETVNKLNKAKNCDAFFHFGDKSVKEIAKAAENNFDTLFIKIIMSSDDLKSIDISDLIKFDYIVSPNPFILEKMENLGLICLDLRNWDLIVEKIDDHNTPRVVGGMMTMNMGDFIAKNVESVLPALDRLVVVDGGSTDNTVDILKSYDKVDLIEFKWDGTHTNSRNKVLDRVRELDPDWYFQVDSDEVMAPDLVNGLDYIMRDSRYNIYKFPILWLTDDNPVQYVASAYHTNLAPYRERMWRWHPSMRFEKWRAVHELLLNPWDSTTEFELSCMYIYHYVYVIFDYEARKKKIATYDSVRRGAGTGIDSLPAYIYEDFPFEIRTLKDNPLKRFEEGA
jgi:hypothetical protein